MEGKEKGMTDEFYIELGRIIVNGNDKQQKEELVIKNKEILNEIIPEIYDNDALLLLIKHGADINSISKDGKSVIIHMININKIDAVKQLVKYGANYKIIDKYNKNLLFHSQSVEMLNYLLELGLDPFHTSKYNQMPIHVFMQFHDRYNYNFCSDDNGDDYDMDANNNVKNAVLNGYKLIIDRLEQVMSSPNKFTNVV
jgi:ankyrin repeat protein